MVAALCLALAGLPGDAAPHAGAAPGGGDPGHTGAAPSGGDPGRAGARPRAGAVGEDLRRVIVEFTTGAALAAGEAGTASVADRRARARRQRERALAEAARERIDLRTRREYDLLVNAVAGEVPAGDVARLEQLDGVAAVHPDRRLRALLDVSVPLVGAPALWEASDPQGAPVTGAGRTVAIVDTGVDYTHPDLGGGFGPGHKVVAGYDYVGDDADPMDDHGHGTHVAGIVAADGEVTGVAPGAAITAYKVLNAGGGGFESDIIAGIEDAADPANPHRADVINLSLGAFDDGEGPLDGAVEAASASGVLVVAAAGNSGPWSRTIASPASAESALAVGASISGVLVPEVGIVAPEARPLETARASYSASAPEEPVTAEVVDVGLGHAWDFEGVDVEGKAVLVQGSIDTGSGPARLAEERGAVAALISTRPRTPVAPGATATPGPDTAGHDFVTASGRFEASFDGRFSDIVVVTMPPSEYGAIERLRLRDEGPVEVQIAGVDATDEIARFSSRGPTRAHTLKPELVAPGVDILSTLPPALGDDRYRFSGTSMAAPHVAGAAALLGQLHPGWSAGEVRSALVAGTRPAGEAGPLEQGAGRLDVPGSAGPALLASPPALSLGVAGGTGDTLEAAASVTVTNPTDEPVAVTFRHEPHDGEATVEVDPRTVTLAAGAREAVAVTLTAARTGADADLTGWVVAEAAGAEALRVPYAAFERVLRVHVPDPVFSEAEALVFSPADLEAAPEAVITGPNGHRATARGEHDHAGWWRVALPLGEPGAHRVEVTASMAGAPASADGTLSGSEVFDVLAEHQRLRGSSSWQPVGPDTDGGVLAPAGPRGLAVATSEPSTLFLTGDRGRTWRQHTDLPIAAAKDGLVAVDPGDPERLYYAVSGGDWDVTYRGKVLASPDGGTTWRTLPFPDVAVNDLHAGEGVVVATSLDGLHVSRDRGDTWELAPAPWGGGEQQGSALVGDDAYVATLHGLWVARDLSSGSPALELLWEPPGFPWVYDVTGDGDRLFASTLDGWTGTVHRSADGGRTWEPLLQTEGPVRTVDLVGGDLVATGHGTLLVSRDGGDTWEALDEPIEHGFVVGTAAWEQPGRSGTAPGRSGAASGGPPGGGPPGGDMLLGLMHAGVWSSDGDGDAWRRIGVQGVTVHDLAIVPSAEGERLVAGTRQDVYATEAPTAAVTPEVRDWGTSGAEGMVGTDVPHVAVSPEDPDVLFRTFHPAVFGFTIQRSGDGGATWQAMHHELQEPLALLVHPAAPERVYASFWSPGQREDELVTGLLASGDGGETWHVHLHDDPFVAIAGDPRDPDRLWLGGRSGLYRSDDGGVTAELVAPGAVSAIAIDPRKPGRVVAGGEELRVSDDGGETFRTGDRADLPVAVGDIVTSPADPDVLYAGTRMAYTPAGLLQPGRGVLVSRDGGSTWENLSDGLQNRSVTSLALTADGRYLFAGTTAGGVHRLRVP